MPKAANVRKIVKLARSDPALQHLYTLYTTGHTQDFETLLVQMVTTQTHLLREAQEELLTANREKRPPSVSSIHEAYKQPVKPQEPPTLDSGDLF